MNQLTKPPHPGIEGQPEKENIGPHNNQSRAIMNRHRKKSRNSANFQLEVLRESAVLAIAQKQSLIDQLMKIQWSTPEAYDDMQAEIQWLQNRVKELQIEKEQLQKQVKQRMNEFDREKGRWSEIYRQVLIEKEELSALCLHYQQQIDELKSLLLEVTVEKTQLEESQRAIVKNYEAKDEAFVPGRNRRKQEELISRKSSQYAKLVSVAHIEKQESLLLNDTLDNRQQNTILQYTQTIDQSRSVCLQIEEQWLKTTSPQKSNSSHNFPIEMASADPRDFIIDSGSNKTAVISTHNLKQSLKAINALDNFSIGSHWNKYHELQGHTATNQTIDEQNSSTLFPSCRKILQASSMDEFTSFNRSRDREGKEKQQRKASVYWATAGLVVGFTSAWLIFR